MDATYNQQIRIAAAFQTISAITLKEKRAIVLPPLIFRVAERNEQPANALDASEASSEISEIDKKLAASK